MLQPRAHFAYGVPIQAGAAYVTIHQASTGVAGVSDKYGKRSWTRYPALWTLKKIDSLPNPVRLAWPLRSKNGDAYSLPRTHRISRSLKKVQGELRRSRLTPSRRVSDPRTVAMHKNGFVVPSPLQLSSLMFAALFRLVWLKILPQNSLFSSAGGLSKRELT